MRGMLLPHMHNLKVSMLGDQDLSSTQDVHTWVQVLSTFIVLDPCENDDPFGLMETRRLQCLPVQNAKCLRRINGELKLKKSHEYYYQIQGQLGLTGMQWSDLMVLCKDDYHIKRIYFDQEFFDSMCTNLNKFYFEFFLCTLF